MTPAEGLDALDRMLAVDFAPQIVASTVPLHVWLDKLNAEQKAARAPASADAAGKVSGPVFSRPDVATAFTAPRDDIERELAGVWSGLLGVAEVGIHDDFFELGGQSLVAVRFFQRIGKKYGVDLPLATLFQAPTIAECAALLRQQLGIAEVGDGATSSEVQAATAASSDVAEAATVQRPPAFHSLVPIQRGDGRTPLFCIHGAGGNVLIFRDIAKALDPRQPVFGLQAHGIDGATEPHSTIEAMATAYLAELRHVQPHGPYLLMGYSGGGVVAFEMARQLTFEGEEIGLLAFLDTFHPQASTPKMNLLTRLDRLGREGPRYLRAIKFRHDMNTQHARDQQAIAEHQARSEAIPLALRETYIMDCFGAAAARYQPQPWRGRATLYRAALGDYFFQSAGPMYGWDREILGGVDLVMVPGTHDNLLLGANAQLVVRSLSEAIARATSPQAPPNSLAEGYDADPDVDLKLHLELAA
jgi:thioesterase domain-containing protein